MNHSEAAQILNFAKQTLTQLYEDIYYCRQDLAKHWEKATPETRTGRDWFQIFNMNRNEMRRLQRERKAWEALARLLKDEIQGVCLLDQIMRELTDGIGEEEDATAWHLNQRGW